MQYEREKLSSNYYFEAESAFKQYQDYNERAHEAISLYEKFTKEAERMERYANEHKYDEDDSEYNYYLDQAEENRKQAERYEDEAEDYFLQADDYYKKFEDAKYNAENYWG